MELWLHFILSWISTQCKKIVISIFYQLTLAMLSQKTVLCNICVGFCLQSVHFLIWITPKYSQNCATIYKRKKKNQWPIQIMGWQKWDWRRGRCDSGAKRAFKETQYSWRAAGKRSCKILRHCKVWTIQSLIWQCASQSLFFHRQELPWHGWIKCC